VVGTVWATIIGDMAPSDKVQASARDSAGWLLRQNKQSNAVHLYFTNGDPYSI